MISGPLFYGMSPVITTAFASAASTSAIAVYPPGMKRAIDLAYRLQKLLWKWLRPRTRGLR